MRESYKDEKREVKRYLAAIRLLSLLITLKVPFQYSVLEHENGKKNFTAKPSKRRRKNVVNVNITSKIISSLSENHLALVDSGLPLCSDISHNSQIFCIMNNIEFWCSVFIW